MPNPLPSSNLASLPNVAIQTGDGIHLLTAVDEGGQNGNGALVALHTDRKVSEGAEAWETFQLIWLEDGPPLVNPTRFALKTSDGFFLTATNSGGVPGLGDGSCPIHSDAETANTWEMFTMVLDTSSDPFTANFITPDGQHYLTATNGGGVSQQAGAPLAPVTTALREPSFTETFTVVTPYRHFGITFIDQLNGDPILDAVCEDTNAPFAYGPLLENNVTVIGLTATSTSMTWQAEGYQSTTFTIDLLNPETGYGITIPLARDGVVC